MRIISLDCIAGPMRGQTFKMSGRPVFLFGRYAKASFNLSADAAISHIHFLIDISEGRVRIVDLGSTNGLVINDRHYGGKIGKPLDDYITLRDGDTILAGASLFRLKVSETDELSTSEELFLDGVSEGHSPHPDRLTAVISRDGAQEEPPATEDAPTAPEAEITHPRQPHGLPAIEGYAILEKIASGGKGIVYKAIKEDTGATAAVKILLFNRSKSKKQRSLEMFRREIQITRQLQHPNIIRYLGDGMSQGSPYLAIEYVEGGSLDAHLHELPGSRMDLPEAVPLFLQLLDAVAYMHSQSLVHRDIKPKNILLDVRRGGSLAAKLSDMGLASRFSNQESDDFLPIVSEGGTPAYMPPEQLTDLTRAIPQSDVFSASATFYQMVTGSLLYDFTGKDQHQTIIEGNIKPILHLRPDLPMSVANVISKGLSYNPEDRYANADEMQEAFRKSLS